MHGERGSTLEDNWAMFLKEDEDRGRPYPPFARPDNRTESLWSQRRRNGGFKQDQFPPINIEDLDNGWGHELEPLPALLQLLFVAAPENLHALASTKGRAWDLNDDHPAVELVREGTYIPSPFDRICLHGDWTSLATGPLFQGNMGVLIHHYDYEEREEPVVVAETEYHLLEIHDPEPIYNWENYFRQCMGPQSINLAGNRPLGSIQTFVNPENLPAHVSVFLYPDGGQGRELPLFPRGDFVMYFRKKNNSVEAARVRWVGGVYSGVPGPFSHDVVVFDWGDEEGSVGYSETGLWATDPPKRYSREEMEEKMDGELAIGLMLFRRV